MKNKKKNNINTKYVMALITIFCVAGIGVSIFSGFSAPASNGLLSTVLAPMQEGVNSLGTLAANFSEKRKTIAELEEENSTLTNQIDVLQSQIKSMENNLKEYDDLLELLELSKKFPNYDMTAARIISKESSNWYNSFTINKGSLAGIEKNMNVIADNGLVGVVTEVTPATSTVRSIIDDSSSVSGMISNSLDICIVNGKLDLIDTGLLEVELISKDAAIMDGDEVVTSYISEKFLPGILIGYISDITIDESELTYNAKLTPAVDFQHLSNVLVIKTLKSELTDEASSNDAEIEEETTTETETETETESQSEEE